MLHIGNGHVRREKKWKAVTGWVSYMLIDVNENKQYGNFLKLTIDLNGEIIDPTDYNFVPIVCRVRGAFCHSEAQWKQLLKPYSGRYRLMGGIEAHWCLLPALACGDRGSGGFGYRQPRRTLRPPPAVAAVDDPR